MSTLDDEIQYIGTRNARGADLPFGGPPRRRVTGIKLHVDCNGDDPAFTLTFRENVGMGSVVHIGRKPANDRRKYGTEAAQDMALFRCAVVSRNHAKITFDDEDGCAYITDLHSHHGTHLRKPGEIASRMLRPGNAFVLVDGDIITFGKTVGRDTELVRPVIVHIELLHAEIRPLVVPSQPLASAHLGRPIRKLSFPRSGSGRYGVNDLLSPSSQSSSSSSSSSAASSDPMLSDDDSEIEEVSGPSAQRGHGGLAYELLRRLLPPAQSPINLVSASVSRSRSVSRARSPSIVPLSVAPQADVIEYVDRSEASESLEQVARAASEASSNMDLSPPPPEPVIIGAWPSTRLSTPIHSRPVSPRPSPAPPQIETSPIKDTTAAVQPVDDELTGMAALLADFKRSTEANPSSSEEIPDAQPAAADADDESDKSNVAELKAQVQCMVSSLSDMQSEVDELHSKVNDNDLRSEVARFNSALEELHSELDGLHSERDQLRFRITEVSERSAEAIEGVNERISESAVELAAAQDTLTSLVSSTVPALEVQIEHIACHAKDAAVARTEQLLTEEFVVKALSGQSEIITRGVATISDLVTEMQAMRANLESKVQQELELVQQARKAAIDSIGSQLADIPIPTRKRKRCEDDESAGMQSLLHDEAALVGGDSAVTSFSGLDMPPPKRARRVMKTVAQTATVMAVGAVAAWSALAFA